MARFATTFRRRRLLRGWNLEMLEGRALLSTLTVLNNADLGPGSLRDAISMASTGDVINFDPSLSGQSIVVYGELQINKDLDIEGLGATNLTISSQAGRVFDIVDASTTVTIAGLTVADGVEFLGGGGLYNSGATVNLNDCIFSNNEASNGGGLYNDGGTVNLNDTILSGNRAWAIGGGVYSTGGTVSLSHSTISGNSASFFLYPATDGYSSSGGGIFMTSGALQISHSTISGNSAIAEPGAEGQPWSMGTASGGGISLSSGSLQVSYSTISGNAAVGGAGHPSDNSFGGVAWDGGGASGGGVFIQDATASITNSDVSGNIATGGQGGTGVPYFESWGGPGAGSGYFSTAGLGGNGQGGGIACVGSSSLLLQSNLLAGNQTSAGDGGPVTMDGIPSGAYYLEYGGSGGNGYGGGLFASSSTSTVVNNTFVNNSSGGGLGQPGEIHLPNYVYVPVNGSNGAGTGGAISGTPALLQNNDFAGNAAATSGSDADSLTPLYVNQFTVNGGQIQRSNDTSVSVTFNQSTNVQALIDNGTITSAVQIVSAGSPLSLTPDRYHYDASTNTLTIDLTVGGSGVSYMTILSDGWYHLQLDTGQITALGSAVNHLNLQNASVSPDGQVRYDFFRLLGDLNGDGVVSIADVVIERNQIIGYAGALPTNYGDINGDGVVDINDFIAIRMLLGHTLPPMT